MWGFDLDFQFLSLLQLQLFVIYSAGFEGEKTFGVVLALKLILIFLCFSNL